jgi:hypothetical protein
MQDRTPQTEPPMMIYIMGRGHNGSTVLDGILGNAMEIESLEKNCFKIRGDVRP